MIKSKLQSPSKESAEAVARISRKIYAASSELESWATQYAKHHLDRIAIDLDLTKKFAPDGGRLIEIGSAPFLYTIAATDLGFSLQGVDIAPDRFKDFIHEQRLTVHKCDIERQRLPFPDQFADAIILNEVFEHLRIDLIFTFQEIFRVCKPGGVLLLSTPNLRSAGGINNFLRHGKSFSLSNSIYDEYRKLHSIGHMGHAREYTFNDVARFLEEVGFEVRQVIYRGKYGNRRLRLASSLFSNLLPFMTLVSEKPSFEPPEL